MSYQKQDLIRYRIEKSLTTFEEAKSLSTERKSSFSPKKNSLSLSRERSLAVTGTASRDNGTGLSQ